MKKVGKESEDEDIISQISKLSLKEELITVKKSLIGSYSWKSKNSICVPGFPSKLKKNFLSIRVGKLVGEDPSPEGVHPNEHLHKIYFEPLEEVLKYAERDLKEFQLVTDRNNLRKIDACLQNDKENYPNFVMYLRKYGDVLVVKREEEKLNGTTIGKKFEEALCEHSSIICCHLIVESEILIDGKEIKILLRGEVDCVSPDVKIPNASNYSLDHESSDGLKVFKLQGIDNLKMDDIRELKMARELKDHHMYQSWILGVPRIVHGAGQRFNTPVSEGHRFKQNLSRSVKALLQYGDQIKDKETYTLRRKDGGDLVFAKANDDRKWLTTL